MKGGSIARPSLVDLIEKENTQGGVSPKTPPVDDTALGGGALPQPAK